MRRGKALFLLARTRMRSLFDETIPTHLHTIIRVSVGMIYFWFGFLKFPFIPGGSSAEALVGSWGALIDPELFMLFLAVFETVAGLLLLLNIRTRHVAFVLTGHVCGTFATVFMGAEQVFHPEYGVYSLTLSGQYIVKNLLILSSCISLSLATPRRHKRLPLRITGRMRLDGTECPILTKDFSLSGIAFLVHLPDHAGLARHDRISLCLDLPLAEQATALQARIAHMTRVGQAASSLHVIGCEFLEKAEAARVLGPYLSTSTDTVAQQGATLLVPQEVGGKV